MAKRSAVQSTRQMIEAGGAYHADARRVNAWWEGYLRGEIAARGAKLQARGSGAEAPGGGPGPAAQPDLDLAWSGYSGAPASAGESVDAGAMLIGGPEEEAPRARARGAGGPDLEGAWSGENGPLARAAGPGSTGEAPRAGAAANEADPA